MIKKIAKGVLVKLNDNACFTTNVGGGLRYPLTNRYNDEQGLVRAHRPVTQEETDAWYDSDASKGMTSAGDTKLPPRSTYVPLVRGRTYQVLRARCQSPAGYGNPTPGMTMLLCTHTGEEAYIKRDLIEVA